MYDLLQIYSDWLLLSFHGLIAFLSVYLVLNTILFSGGTLVYISLCILKNILVASKLSLCLLKNILVASKLLQL